jgi:hypothetical protein
MVKGIRSYFLDKSRFHPSISAVQATFLTSGYEYPLKKVDRKNNLRQSIFKFGIIDES